MKAFVISLGYVPSRIWKSSLERYKSLMHGGLETHHIFLNQHYPLREQENNDELRSICESNGVEWIDIGKNLGLSKGFNHCLDYIRQKYNPDSSDIVIGYDPDSSPVSPGFDMALATCFTDPNVVWASLYGPWLRGQFRHKEYFINQIKVHETQHAIMNSVCAIRWDFLNKVGGFAEPNPYYGGQEMLMWPLIQKHGKWVFTVDWWEDHEFHHLQDEEYKVWKWCLCHERSTTKSFADWLNNEGIDRMAKHYRNNPKSSSS